MAGSQLPQIDATGQVGRAHINGSFLYAPTDYISVTGNRFGLGPTLAYNVDIFGGTRRQIESQRAATAAARDQALNTYVTLVDQTVITGFDFAATRAQIEVTHSLIDELQSQFELTRTLENAGKITRSDTLQARAQLENLRATLPGLEQQLDVYRNALAQLSGTTPDAFTPPELSLRDFTLPTQLPVSLPSQLVRQRPDILAAEDQLHQASAAIGVAEAARLPSLGISAQYAQQTSTLSDFFTRPGGHPGQSGQRTSVRRFSTAARSPPDSTRPRSTTGSPSLPTARRSSALSSRWPTRCRRSDTTPTATPPMVTRSRLRAMTATWRSRSTGPANTPNYRF